MMIKSYKLTELAKLLNIGRSTIKNHPEEFIPVQINTYETKRSGRWYGIRYILTGNVLVYLLEQDVRHDVLNENKN